jgi:hypothetical protein
MDSRKKCLIKKVTKKTFFVLKIIVLTFGMVIQGSLGHFTYFSPQSVQNMKNIFLATCLAAGVGAAPVAVAGPGDREYAPAMVSRATTLTRALDRRIHFNEGQFIAVKQLHLRMLTERAELELKYSGAEAAEAAERDALLADSQQHYENELSNLLQPRQVVAYYDLRNNFTAHRIK